MKIKSLFLTLVFLATGGSLFGQTSFYTNQATQAVNIVGSPQPVQGPIPFAGVRVCNLPLTQTQPCLPLATITDSNGNTLSNSIGSNFGQFTADSFGRFTFGCTTGANLQLQWAGASNTPQANIPITCPGSGLQLAGNNIFTGNNTFGPGSLTVSGTGTFTGLLQCKNFENIRCIDPTNSQGWAGTDLAGWVSSAFAALPQQSGTVLVTGGASYATPSASITVGVSPCVNAPSNGWSQTLIFDNVQVTINNPIKVLCTGYVSTTGQNPFGSWITAGASLGTNPMIDVGDAVTVGPNMGVSYMRLNCNSQAGCTGIRVRGINDLSFFNYNQIQNYLVNGINVDCSTASGGGNFTLRGNFVAAATGASDAIVLNACNGAILEKNSGVSNSGAAITGASLSIKGNTNNQEPIIVINNHSEKHTDNVSVDNAAAVIIDGVDVSNGTTNVIHIKSTATGNVYARFAHSNQLSNLFPVILNDVTGTNLSSNNPPAANGVIPEYKWQSGQFEQWIDTNGFHWTPNSSTKPLFINSQAAIFSIINQQTNNLIFSSLAPTISTHFNTSGDSIVQNGTLSFTITVGTGTGTSTGAISLPTAATGWNCWLTNQTRAAQIQQTGSTTASATFTNFGTTFAATNWTNSDVLRGGCTAN